MMFNKFTIFNSNHVSKYIFESDDVCVESVLYQYQDRTVICISTMCGCPVGCKMCGTGKHFIRNLTSSEIVEQVTTILESNKPRSRFQIMFMSMGEPFLNYNNVKKSIIKLHDLYPTAELLISTIAPYRMLDNWQDFITLSTKIPQIGLQFSMHAMNDNDRNKIIPYRMKVDIGTIIHKALDFHKYTNRPAFFNFIINQDNKVTLCHEIYTALVNGGEDKIYLTFSVECPMDNTNYQPFNYSIFDYVQRELDMFNTRMFNPEGQDDIGAGCGQLWYVQEWMKNRTMVI